MGYGDLPQEANITLGSPELMMPATETVTFNFVRVNRFAGSAAKIKVMLDGEELLKIKNKGVESVELPSQRYELHMKNTLNLGPTRKLIVYPFLKEMTFIVDPPYYWAISPELDWMQDIGANKKQLKKLPKFKS